MATEHHIVATFDGTTRSIYTDGVLRGSDNPINHNVPFANNLTIGTTNINEFFDGSIDELRIWNVGRSQAQILAGMNTTLPANTLGLAAYYRLDEGSGLTTVDVAGHGNDGTLVNSPAWMVPSTVPIPAYSSVCVAAPKTFTITVNPTATVDAVANQTVCNGGNTTAINFTSPTTGGTIVYNWTNTTTSIGLAASGTGDIASFVATNSGNAPVTATITVTPEYTNGAVTCTGTPITFTITVNPSVTVNAVANQTVCNGNPTTAVNFSSPATGGTIVYNWTNTTPSIGLAASGTGDIASFTATNGTNVPVIATITVTPEYTNGAVTCTGAPISFTITVNPTPNAVATPPSQTICSGPITTIVLTGNVAGTTYNWTRDNTAGVTGIAASGSGDISGALTNTTAAPVTVTFTITPTANGCPGIPVTATVLVNPIPTAVATPASQTICSAGTITTIVLSGAVIGNDL